MSYSTLYAVFRTKASALEEYTNGWGTGPLVWGYLNEKFLSRERHEWGGGNNDGKLWGLATDPRVDLALRACLAMTFDYAVVPRAHLKEMGELLQKGGEILAAHTPGYVNHFPQIGKNMTSLKLDSRAVGVGLNCTSVGDIWSEWVPARKQAFDVWGYIGKARAA
jgi:hypothetical protein